MYFIARFSTSFFVPADDLDDLAAISQTAFGMQKSSSSSSTMKLYISTASNLSFSGVLSPNVDSMADTSVIDSQEENQLWL